MPNLEGHLSIVGHLGKDPVTTTTPGGHALCKFSVAVNYGKKENRKTEWFNVVTWHDIARGCALSLNKGCAVIVIGKIRQRTYEGKYYTDLVADYVGQVLAVKKEEPVQEPEPEPEYDAPEDVPEEPLPF